MKRIANSWPTSRIKKSKKTNSLNQPYARGQIDWLEPDDYASANLITNELLSITQGHFIKYIAQRKQTKSQQKMLIEWHQFISRVEFFIQLFLIVTLCSLPAAIGINYFLFDLIGFKISQNHGCGCDN